MSEDMFESLIFLKVNRRFWNEVDVAEADRTRMELKELKESDNESDSESDSESDDDDNVVQ